METGNSDACFTHKITDEIMPTDIFSSRHELHISLQVATPIAITPPSATLEN